nr:uncharacterized protein LOC133614723 [Nerophis lumbriciformis]
MDTALTTAADGGALGARQRQLPTRLESYQVSLPQSLIPHGARAQDRGESVGAQRLQSLSLQTESVCMEDQPHGAHAIPDRPLSPGAADKVSEWNMAIHARDLPSQLTCHMSHPSAAHAGRSYQSRQGSPVLRPPAILNMSVPTYQSPWLSCPVVHSTPLSQPSSLHLGSSRLLQHEPHLSTLPHTTSTALKLQAAMTPTPGSRQENYTLTQSLPSTVTSAWAPSPLTTLNVSMLQPTPQASQAVSYASPQTSVTSGYPSNQPTTVMINNVQERVPPAAQLQYLPMQKTPVNLAPVQQYTPLPSAQPVWQYTPLPSAQPVQQHAPLFAQPAYQPPQIATAPYSAPQLPVAAGTQPVINPSPYSTATPLGTVYHPPSTIATQPLYQSPLPPQNQQLQLYQPVSAPSTQPAYQLVSPPAGFTLQQPPSAQQVQYSPQSQYTPLQVPYTTQSPRQPVPIPELPKLVHDSEREFADLKMALDHLLNPQTELSEHYKYRVLMEHLVLDEAKLIAQSHRHYVQPYTAAMQALQRQYGQPHQLAQSEIADILNSPDLKSGDPKSFQSFALNVDLLVGMLTSLEGPNGMEVMSTGHVDRLLSKLPRHMRDNFVEHLQVQGRLSTSSLNPYNLRDLAEWLKVKAEAQRLSAKMAQRHRAEGAQPANRDRPVPTPRPRTRPVSVYHGADQPKSAETTRPAAKQQKFKRMCLFCKSTEHYLSQCPDIIQRSTQEIEKWITGGQRCRNSGRTNHDEESCTLKKPCSECQKIHLRVLHDITRPGPQIFLITPKDCTSAANSMQGGKVYLKVVPIIISHGTRSLQTYAILDDGAERTIILPAAVRDLNLRGRAESLTLRTVRQDVVHLTGASVDFHVASPASPSQQHLVERAYTAGRLTLTEQSYPIAALQRRYRHLRGLQLQSFNKVQPLLLLGADYTHLITATEPVRFGPKGGPVAIHTALGWTLQGPDGSQSPAASCYYTAFKPTPDDIYQQVERLWQLDVLPFRSERLAVRSRLDQEAVSVLEARTKRVKVGDTLRYIHPCSG